MPDLFHAPNSCSDGILLLLHEIGAPFDAHVVDLRKAAQFEPDYQALNPKGKVPALRRDDGSVLTEFGTIAWWLAQTHPGANLLPDDAETRIRIREALDFMVASVHMRGFTFVKVPMKFAPDPAMQEVLRAHGRDQVEKGLARLSEMLGDQDYLFGDFTIADAALYYLLNWADQEGFAMAPNLSACFARLCDRPAVARVRAR